MAVDFRNKNVQTLYNHTVVIKIDRVTSYMSYSFFVGGATLRIFQRCSMVKPLGGFSIANPNSVENTISFSSYKTRLE